MQNKSHRTVAMQKNQAELWSFWWASKRLSNRFCVLKARILVRPSNELLSSVNTNDFSSPSQILILRAQEMYRMARMSTMMIRMDRKVQRLTMSSMHAIPISVAMIPIASNAVSGMSSSMMPTSLWLEIGYMKLDWLDQLPDHWNHWIAATYPALTVRQSIFTWTVRFWRSELLEPPASYSNRSFDRSLILWK